MPEFSFVGAAYEAASITQDDQACINLYPEVDPTKAPGERGVMALLPCPGLLTRTQLITAEVRGMHTIPGGAQFITVVGNNAYILDSNFTATLIGAVDTVSGPVQITDNGVAALITTGGTRYTYNWTTASFLPSTDGGFQGANVCDEIDNFMIYNRPNTNEWGCTDAGDIVSNPLNFAAMLGDSGNLVCLIADHRQVLLLGETYSERWVDVGSFPFPFSIIPGSSMQHGCAAKFSVARLGESIAFLANDTRGHATVVQWGASQPSPQRISTFAIENAIQSYAVTSDAIGYTYAQAGHEFYMLTFPTQDVTWCFDLSTQLWHRRAWRDPNTGVYKRHRGNCCTVFGDDILVGDFENGKIYALDQSTYTDAGDPLPRLRRCRHITTDLKRQFFSDLQIQFQPGMGLATGQGSDPTCILRWSNDGGFTWGNDHTLTVGKIGRYKHRAIKRRLGWARDRIYEVIMTDPIFWAVVSANLNASSGAN